MSFLAQVKETIKRYKLIENNDRIVIGVSGGADSVALSLALNSLKKNFHLKLYIAHLDHRLRRSSAKDARFVKKLAQGLKIPAYLGLTDVMAQATKGSTEEAARKARLDFLFKIARTVKAKKIALGHNFDDQAETVLMRILKGTGLYGLSGILPKRTIGGFQVIRPLLEIKKSQIKQYLNTRHIKPCLDISNTKDIYFRNKLRNRLIPLLEKEYNANVKQALWNLGQTAGSDYDFLLGIAQKKLQKKRMSFNLEQLNKLHPALLRIIARQAIAGLKGDTRRITFQHLREIEDLISRRPFNSIVDLPKGISVVKKKRLLFYRRKTQ
jgi:tRNA(Ile)-lysidine synthase